MSQREDDAPKAGGSEGRVETDSHAQFDELDRVLEHIGMGRFHWMVFLILGLYGVADGAEMLVLSLTTRALEREWGLSPALKGLLGSSIFVGFLVGSLVAGPLGDKFGRRLPFLCSTAALFVTGFASAFAPDYTSLVLLRSLVGASIGALAPLGSTLLVEFSPTSQRSMIFMLSGLFFPLGEILAASVAWFVCARRM